MLTLRDIVPTLIPLTLHLFALLYSLLFGFSCLLLMRRGFLIRPRPSSNPNSNRHGSSSRDMFSSPFSSSSASSSASSASSSPSPTSQYPPPPNVLTHPSLRIPHIPPELTDRIIDHLHNDKAALKACSSVSKTWLPRSRYYFWQFVHLDLKNYSRFDDILREVPDIGFCVKSLKITVHFFEEKPNWVDETLPRIARRLPAVEQLALAGNGTYRAAPFHPFTSVKRLRLLDCEFPSVNEVIALICFLPSLQELFSNNVLVGMSASLVKPPASQPRPKLKKLEFLGTRLDPYMFTDWMIQDGIHEHVESIILRPLQKSALIAVGRFVAAVGPRLKHFEVALIALQLQGGFSDVIGPFFSLAPATQIRSLEFGSPAGYAARYGSDDMSFSWISLMLSQITSPLVEEITFWLSQGDLLGLGTVEWKHVINLLEAKDSPKFGKLKRVNVNVWGQDKVTGEIRRVVESQLKGLKERKMLGFDMQLSERNAFGRSPKF